MCHEFRASANPHVRELVHLLSKWHLRALFETHDAVVKRREREASAKRNSPPLLIMPTEKAEAVRIVGLRRQPDEPLVSFIFIYVVVEMVYKQ